MNDDAGQIITFYSYKGGTGRTMALANVACLLAERQEKTNGRPVLMVDWDLEAPGLHRFFRKEFKKTFSGELDVDSALDNREGLMDFFWRLNKATESFGVGENSQSQDEARTLLDEIRPENYILPTDIPSLSLLKAGRTDGYSTRVNTFEWDSFYNRASWLIDAFAQRLSALYQYVLIDSRTGLTDTSGICTMLMPEKLVVVFTPNRQSISGVLDLIERATNYRKQSNDLRPLVAFPVPSRVESTYEQLRSDWRYGNKEDIQGFQPQFQKTLTEAYKLEECDLEKYFNEVQIPQSPIYAYGESIAVREERSLDKYSLTDSYKKLVNRLINTPSPWQETNSVPDFDFLRRSFVFFPNQNQAKVIRPPADAPIPKVARALGVKEPESLLLIIGGKDLPKIESTRFELFVGGAIARIAVEGNIHILDSGTKEGAAGIIGAAVAAKPQSSAVLIGVAPVGSISYPDWQRQLGETSDGEKKRTPLDPNHTHFVLLEDKAWADAGMTLTSLATELARNVPVVAMLVGGSQSDLRALMVCVQQGWKIIVLEGSGGLADEVAEASKQYSKNNGKDSSNRESTFEYIDPSLHELVSHGNIEVLPVWNTPREIDQTINASLSPRNALPLAWGNWETLDKGARLQVERSRMLHLMIVVIGIAASVLALVIAWVGTTNFQSAWLDTVRNYIGVWRAMLSFLTIATVVCMTASRRFQYRNERLLQFGAGAILSEILRYRTRTGAYATAQSGERTRESTLLERVSALNRSIAYFDINVRSSSSREPTLPRNWLFPGADDGFSRLHAERYLEIRLSDQMRYYERRADRLESKVKRFMWVTYVLGGLATFLAAVGKAWWVAAIFAVAAPLMAYFVSGQDEREMTICLQKATDLRNIYAWWEALPNEEKESPGNFESLVNNTENVLSHESRRLNLARAESGVVAF